VRKTLAVMRVLHENGAIAGGYGRRLPSMPRVWDNGGWCRRFPASPT